MATKIFGRTLSKLGFKILLQVFTYKRFVSVTDLSHAFSGKHSDTTIRQSLILLKDAGFMVQKEKYHQASTGRRINKITWQLTHMARAHLESSIQDISPE
ncbi:MAG: hypothetical protein R3B53_03890 [Candidatus Paceibacterota bacterium]